MKDELVNALLERERKDQQMWRTQSERLQGSMNSVRARLGDDKRLVDDLIVLLIGRLRLADTKYVLRLAKELRGFDAHRMEWDQQP